MRGDTHTHTHCRTHLLYIHTAGRIKHTDARHTHTHMDTSLILLIAHVDTGGVQTDSTEIKAASSDHWSCCVVAVLEYVAHKDVSIRLREEKSNGKISDDVVWHGKKGDFCPRSVFLNAPSLFTLLCFPAVCETYLDIYTARRESQKYNNELTPNPIIRGENTRTWTSQREDCSPDKNRRWLNGSTARPACCHVFVFSPLIDLLLSSFFYLTSWFAPQGLRISLHKVENEPPDSFFFPFFIFILQNSQVFLRLFQYITTSGPTNEPKRAQKNCC